MAQKTQYAIAVDLGATNLRTALVTASGKVRYKKSVPTVSRGKDGKVLTKQIIKEVKRFFDGGRYDITGIGVSVAGPLTKNGEGFLPPNLPYALVDVVKPLKKIYDVDIVLLNDTKAAVVAEWIHGHGKNGRVKNLVYVTVSSGIGCGAIVDGHLLRGLSHSAGEMGHAAVDVSFVDGVHDWEYYCAGKHVLQFYENWKAGRGIDGKVYKSAKAFFRAKNDDKTIKAFFGEWSRVNAQGVANVMFAYDPEMIVFGGGIALNSWELFVRGVRCHIDRSVFASVPQFKLTTLGDDISLIGVGTYVFYKNVQ